LTKVVCDDIKADEHLEANMGIETVLLLVEQESLETILQMPWNDVYQGMESGSFRNSRPKKSDRLSRLFDIDCEAEILDWMEDIGAKDGSVREILQNLNNGEEGLLLLMNYMSLGHWECWEARTYLYLDVALDRVIESRKDLYSSATWKDLRHKLANLPEDEFADKVCIDWMERRKQLGETIDEKEDPKIIPTFEAHTRNSKLLVHAITTWENTEGVIGIVGREHLEAIQWGHGVHNLSNYLHQ
jgi:hypothetical protein